jgi:hypothetical protein
MEYFDNYVFVMVNDNVEQSLYLKFMTCMHHRSVRLGDQVDRLDPQYFVVENHSDEIDGKPKYEHLAYSIDESTLHEEEYGLVSYIKTAIPISTFTIFINGQNTFPYYPLSIATIDISNIGGENYMYINGFADSNEFHSCASQLMQSIKMIARIYNCLEIRYHSDEEFVKTIIWFKQQGFNDVDRDTILEEGLQHNLVYMLSAEDGFYKRAAIKGEVSVIEDLKECSLVVSF